MLLLSALVFAVLCAAAQSATVLYVHNAGSSYIEQNTQNVALQSQGLSATVHALLSTDPSFVVSPQASKQVEQVVSADLFSRPQVLLSVQLVGVEHDEPIHKYLENIGTVSSFSFVGGAEALLQAVATVRKSGSVSHTPTDYHAWQHCVDKCTEDELKELCSSFGGNYTSETGKLDVAYDGRTVELDMSQAADRLWAVELGSFVKMLQARIPDHSQRDEHAATLIESTLVGVQAVAAQYSQTSDQFAAALHNVLVQLNLQFSQLSEAVGGKALMQLSLLERVPLDRLYELVNWRTEQTRRNLLVRQLEEVESSSDEWSTGASAVLTFILLLAAGLGGVYCLMYMKYKQDTLLYMRPKAD